MTINIKVVESFYNEIHNLPTWGVTEQEYNNPLLKFKNKNNISFRYSRPVKKKNAYKLQLDLTVIP